MAITLANALTQMRYELNESTAEFWTDAELTIWLQEGTRVFSATTLMYESTDDITLVANQLVYDSSDESWIGNCIEPYAAIYDDQSNGYSGLIKVHPRQIGAMSTFTAGQPKYYCMFGRNFYIWPLTTAAIVTAGGTVSVLNSQETDDITAISDEYQHLPIMYALGKAKQKDQKFADATSLFTQFHNAINFERRDKHNREVDSVESFRTPKRGGNTGARG